MLFVAGDSLQPASCGWIPVFINRLVASDLMWKKTEWHVAFGFVSKRMLPLVSKSEVVVHTAYLNSEACDLHCFSSHKSEFRSGCLSRS